MTCYDSSMFSKPDREYVLVQGQYFPDTDNYKAMIVNEGGTARCDTVLMNKPDAYQDAGKGDILS